MNGLLRHPLTVALGGTAIAGVLVEWVARRWQSRQKALEMRVNLASEISESLMGLTAHLDAMLKRAKLAQGSGSDERSPELQEELDRARESLNAERLEFEVREVVIGTKLHAYLEDQELGDRWRRLAEDAIKYVDHDQRLPDGLHDEKKNLTARVLRARSVLGPSRLPQWLLESRRTS